jgi:hypothetical protein
VVGAGRDPDGEAGVLVEEQEVREQLAVVDVHDAGVGDGGRPSRPTALRVRS